MAPGRPCLLAKTRQTGLDPDWRGYPGITCGKAVLKSGDCERSAKLGFRRGRTSPIVPAPPGEALISIPLPHPRPKASPGPYPTPPGVWVPSPGPLRYPPGVPRRAPCTLGHLSIPSPSNFGYSPTPPWPLAPSTALPGHSGTPSLLPPPRTPPPGPFLGPPPPGTSLASPSPASSGGPGRGPRAPGWILGPQPGRARSRARGTMTVPRRTGDFTTGAERVPGSAGGPVCSVSFPF